MSGMCKYRFYYLLLIINPFLKVSHLIFFD
jgi:hypothetical protein